MSISKAAGRLAKGTTVFFGCDFQECFRKTIFHYNEAIDAASFMLKSARVLGIPVIMTEQYPEKLTHTGIFSVQRVIGLSSWAAGDCEPRGMRAHARVLQGPILDAQRATGEEDERVVSKRSRRCHFRSRGTLSRVSSLLRLTCASCRPASTS